MDYLYYVFVVLGFLAVVLFLEGVYLAWNAYKGPEVKRIEKRLQAMSAGAHQKSSSLVKQRLLSQTPGIEQLLLQIPRIHQLDRLIMQSGLNLSVAKFIGLMLFAVATGVAIALLLRLPVFAVVAIGSAAGVLPLLYMQGAKHNRMIAIEQQLPDALDLMGRAMTAGHAFPSALQMVGGEMPEPIASEFRIVFDEINYGISTQEAMINLTTRVPSTDLSYFVIAVLIQRETGGNLAELLGNISQLIRARLKLMGTVRVLSAEGRLSAWILTLLPFALGFVLQLMNPQFLSVLWTDPIGQKMVVAALCLMVLGIFAMWRITKIRV
ncbi:MAG: type II secretion system F family protein [Methylotenera sp.]|nr:type II secretion system F family protein [Methylotenera sp.]MDO9232508.1 type II secretion system F family protein [Methylotenera sp.]MDO9388759.1 type II secretion system F family protein [Methylotenera sp.]MDP2403529.1 type II secretion system F family protein [Methylotenera sp.]MDP3095646.1 type II secretion system F family protein [Methylotenera sp.]